MESGQIISGAATGKNSPPSNRRSTLAALLALAIALRFVFVFFPADGIPFSDMKDYHTKAVSIIRTGTYGEVFRPPLYPFFLSLIYRIAGSGPTAVRAAQALLGAGVCWLAYLISRRLSGERAGLLSGMIVACYPGLVVYTCLLMSENLFIPLLIASLALLLWNGPQRLPKCLAAGIVLGAGCLTRSVLLGFIPLAALWLWLRGERRCGVTCLLAALLTIAPWSLRNCRYYNAFVPIDTCGGFNFLVGNNPMARGCQDLTILSELDKRYWRDCKSNVQQSMVGYREGLLFIVDNPARFLRLGVKKLGYLYGLEIRELSWGYSRNYFGYVPRAILIPAAAAIMAAFPILAVMTLFALLFRGEPGDRRRKEWSLLLLLVIYLSAAHFLTFGESRFHLPMIPVLAIFAGRMARSLKPAMSAPSVRRLVFIILVAVLSLNWVLCLKENRERLEKVLGPYGNASNLDY